MTAAPGKLRCSCQSISCMHKALYWSVIKNSPRWTVRSGDPAIVLDTVKVYDLDTGGRHSVWAVVATEVRQSTQRRVHWLAHALTL